MPGRQVLLNNRFGSSPDSVLKPYVQVQCEGPKTGFSTVSLGTPHIINMIDPVEQRLGEEICQHIGWYSTALMRVNSRVVNPLTDVFIGCGTFVRIDNRYGILTAHHVVKEIEPPCRLGLILRAYP